MEVWYAIQIHTLNLTFRSVCFTLIFIIVVFPDFLLTSLHLSPQVSFSYSLVMRPDVFISLTSSTVWRPCTHLSCTCSLRSWQRECWSPRTRPSWSKTKQGTSSTSWRMWGTYRTAVSLKSIARSPSMPPILQHIWPTETSGWDIPPAFNDLAVCHLTLSQHGLMGKRRRQTRSIFKECFLSLVKIRNHMVEDVDRSMWRDERQT